MANIAPIRTTTEVNTIINNARVALASLGIDIVNEEMQGITIDNTLHRDKVYRLLLIDIYLNTILDKNGNILNWFLSTVNTLKFNQILDGLMKLSNMSGPSIPLLLQKNLGLQFFPVPSPVQTGGMIFVSTFDASTNQFPSSGSLAGGNVAKGNFYIAAVAGAPGGQNINAGGAIMALIDNPEQNIANWYFF